MSSAMLPPAPSGGPVDDTAVTDRELLSARSPGGFWRDVFTRLRRNPTAWIGAAIVFVFVFVAVFAPWLAPVPRDSAARCEVHHPDVHSGPRRTAAVPPRARPLRR